MLESVQHFLNPSQSLGANLAADHVLRLRMAGTYPGGNEGKLFPCAAERSYKTPLEMRTLEDFIGHECCV